MQNPDLRLVGGSALANPSMPGPAVVPGLNPRIFLLATLRWPLAARLAIAFARLGSPVIACCPAGHPLEKTRAVERIFRATLLAPLRTLSAALAAAAPDFVIACDDDAALQLHQLHQSARVPAAVRNLIEGSLGRPASCLLASTRGELMRLARAEGVRVPETRQLFALSDLDEWSARRGFPAVIKVDRSWGGQGVAIVHDLEQARAAFRLAARPSWMRALSHLVLRRDPSYCLRRVGGFKPTITIQKFIPGKAANHAAVCWQGEILAGISVAALQTQTPTGPATVVQIIENAEMSVTCARLLRALGVSGFCGLDFVIEAASGDAYLIEVNPRATPVSHLALGTGRDLPAALHARLKGQPAPATVSAIRGDIVAMFPGEWRRDFQSPYLRSAFHDVPWAETELVRDCAQLAWEDRGRIARIRAWLNSKQAAGEALLPLPEIQFGPGSSPEHQGSA